MKQFRPLSVLCWAALALELPCSAQQFKVAMSLLVTAGFTLFLTGCATVERYSLTFRVWDNENWRKFSEPAPNPNLALFEATNPADVLVRYDAFSEKQSRVERHAYYLHLNQSRVGAGTKPVPVESPMVDGMKAVPVLPAPSSLANQALGLSAYAVVTKEGRGFTLYRRTEPERNFDLPVYVETSGTLTRIIWTPFAVAGDAVMVGAVASVVALFCWLEVQTPTLSFY